MSGAAENELENQGEEEGAIPVTSVDRRASIWSRLRVCLTFEWTPKLVWFLEPYKTFKINSCSLEKLKPISSPVAQSYGELPPRELPECPPSQKLGHPGHPEASLDRCLPRLPGSMKAQVTGF